jgi:cell division transport system ATP-binding protein
MLTFKNVSKSFGEVKALKNISFEVKKGDFVFLTGPSGAGKTTLLKLITREYFPDSGEIIFDGANTSNLEEKNIPLLRQRIGVVFQDMKVLPERTVGENVSVALAVIDIPEHDWEARVNQILKLVGLEHKADVFPAQLSGGELQRVALARALVVNPKLILADEPTGNLDWETSEGIMELLEKINKEGKTIIMATHNKLIVEKMAKRVIEIKAGEIVKGGEVEKKEKKETEENDHKKMKVKVEEV